MHRGESSPHLFDMSYAAKWVPTPAHGADKQVHLASVIALQLFPGEGVSRSREMLQSKVLAPLRKVMKVPEVNMGPGQWNIDYTMVSSPSRRASGHSLTYLLGSC